jgi:hypothetical protein
MTQHENVVPNGRGLHQIAVKVGHTGAIEDGCSGAGTGTPGYCAESILYLAGERESDGLFVAVKNVHAKGTSLLYGA